LLPSIVLAHVHVDRTTPAKNALVSPPPKVFQLWCSGGVEAEWSRIVVKDAQGKPVQTGDIRPITNDPKSLEVDLKPLSPGRYKVRWNLIAHDGHRVKGGLQFEVK